MANPIMSGRFRLQQPSAIDTFHSIMSGTKSVRSVVEAAIERVHILEPTLRAWKFFDPAGALKAADATDLALKHGGRVGRFTGVPIGVKDLFAVEGTPTTYGSVIYEGNISRADAEIVRLFRQENSVLLGKTVTTEFAYFKPGPTANPWNINHTPGGSSSGSAVAVSSGMVPVAFGSQTAGSLIRPASYCGVFAVKPTLGIHSLKGAKELAPSLDTLGWLATSADDLEFVRATLLKIEHQPLPDLQPLRLLSCPTHEFEYLDMGGQSAWERAHQTLSRAGVMLNGLSLPEKFRGLASAHKTIMAKEAAISLAPEFTFHRDELSPEIVSLIHDGFSVDEQAYQFARELKSAALAAVIDAFSDFDAILAPSAPGEAPRGLSATGDPIFSRVWTLLGLPCVNVPGLLGPNNLPVGMQLIGRPGDERRLLACARAVHRIFEQ